MKMAKMVDITEKLSFDENPCLVVKGEKIEVDASAETVLKVMGKFSEGSAGNAKNMVDMYNLIFPEHSRKTIEELKLKFNDFSKLVDAAIDLIVDGDEEQGE
jgi:hypothetical protein